MRFGTGQRGSRDRRAVTLLEVVLSMSLLVLLTTMTYWFYGSSLETRRRCTKWANEFRLQSVTLDRIATEIRQASFVTTDNLVGIRGEPERIWLHSVRVPSRELSKDYSFRDEPPPAEYDLVKVEYKIARHPEILHDDGWERALGLARVEHLIPRPDSAETGEAFEDERESFVEPVEELVQEETFDDRFFDELYEEEADGGISLGPEIRWDELYAQEIKHLRFCYYDGYKWWDDWDIVGENPLPQLVLVTVGFEERPPFGEESGLDCEEAEEFCTCLNNDPVDCLPLPEDQLMTVVRVPQADPFFRSRVTRETQALIQGVSGGEGGTREEGEWEESEGGR